MKRGEKVVIKLSRREQRQLLTHLGTLHKHLLEEGKETAELSELIAKVAFARTHKRCGRSAG